MYSKAVPQYSIIAKTNKNNVVVSSIHLRILAQVQKTKLVKVDNLFKLKNGIFISLSEKI